MVGYLYGNGSISLLVLNEPMPLVNKGFHFPRCQCFWLSLLGLPVEEVNDTNPSPSPLVN